MAAAPTFNINLIQEAGYSVKFVAVSLGDVTGWDAHLQVRNRAGGTIYLDVKEGDGITVDGPTSAFTVSFTGVQTALLKAGPTYEYDIFVTAPSSEPVYLCGGTVSVQAAITSPADNG